VRRDLLPHGKLADCAASSRGGMPELRRTLDVFKALEVGHIFKLGTRYSESMRAHVLKADGGETPIVMGSYGIGVERILAAAIELHHDADGIVWPFSIAPFRATRAHPGKEPELAAAAEEVAASLARAGLDVLYDDREERAGVKFKDADLLGIPLRLAVGRRGWPRARWSGSCAAAARWSWCPSPRWSGVRRSSCGRRVSVGSSGNRPERGPRSAACASSSHRGRRPDRAPGARRRGLGLAEGDERSCTPPAVPSRWWRGRRAGHAYFAGSLSR